MTRTQLLDRLAIVVMIAIFAAAVVVLMREFADVSAREVIERISSIPRGRLAAAFALTAMSYLLLTGYDFLALCYVRRRLRARDVLFASFTAFVFSNVVGLQLITGGSTRYRIYRSFGLSSVEIGAIVVFCTIAYATGVITVSGLLCLFDPRDVGALLRLPRSAVIAGGVILLGVTCSYLTLCTVWRKPVAIGGAHLRPPSLPLALAQVALASLDAVAVSTVFYVLLPGDLALSYLPFLSVYLIAATASVLSLVPGGLGVFETAMTILTAPPSKAAALSAYFAYRMIYFVAPFVVAFFLFARHELKGGRARPAP